MNPERWRCSEPSSSYKFVKPGRISQNGVKSTWQVKRIKLRGYQFNSITFSPTRRIWVKKNNTTCDEWLTLLKEGDTSLTWKRDQLTIKISDWGKLHNGRDIRSWIFDLYFRLSSIRSNKDHFGMIVVCSLLSLFLFPSSLSYDRKKTTTLVSNIQSPNRDLRILTLWLIKGLNQKFQDYEWKP